MALPLRDDRASTPFSPTASERSPRAASPWAAAPGVGYTPGGEVGQMQADLAARLAGHHLAGAVVPAAEERLVRFLSVAGGYAALAAGYAGAVLLLWR